ncbi:unnamed protein product [Pieris macdunnoughi]|uniref:Uncharacterized protein n=1 Tax=Pieris macdunnoughi TaxID=345717 RepID=A0A821XCH7_9NEOP|nr:unnamed protein product [Pieris macdunnoughi]
MNVVFICYHPRPSPDRVACELINSESGNQPNRIVILEIRQVAPTTHARYHWYGYRCGGRGRNFCGAFSSKRHTFIGVNDNNFEQTVDEWMNDDLSDCDIEIDDESIEIGLPIITTRNASTEPAIPTDLTPYEAKILETEDQQNDLVLRDLVPSDCFDLIGQETDRFLRDWRTDFYYFRYDTYHRHFL